MKLISLLVSALVLTGCASTPKPVMPEEAYSKFSQVWVGADKCGSQGDMDPVLAAYGKKRIEQEMYAYSFDGVEMTRRIQSLLADPMRISVEECNKAAVVFAGLRDEYDRNSRGSSLNKPTKASCYTTPYGNVTNCVSY